MTTARTAWTLRLDTRPVVRPRTLLIPLVIVLTILADRLQVSVSTGGRGDLALLDLIAPPVAIFTIARYGRARSLAYLRSPIFLLAVLPYVALSGALPIMGVIFYGYPERTLLSLTACTTVLSLLTVGAALSDRDDQAWARWIFGAIVIQFGYSLAQAIYLARGPGWELFQPFHDWDLSLQAVSGVLVQARSSGLFFNPNELGLWAGMAAIIAWVLLPGRLRVAGVILGIGTLVLSQSRGASVALIVAATFGVVMAFAQRRVSGRRALNGAISFVVVVVVVGLVIAVVGLPATILPRFESLLAVLSQGPSADANLAGRLDYWQAVISLNAYYPWGTWGPPELLLGTAVDSSWFQAFAQGSVPYAAALGLLFVSTWTLVRSRYRYVLCVLAVFIAFAGLTQTPFGYPPIILFWVWLGSALQDSVSVAETTSEPAPKPAWTQPGRTRPEAPAGSGR
jgi:hypothetical protein